MAITAPEAPAAPLTYEGYMAGEEEMKRYEILDGVREDMPNPTPNRQRILLNIAQILNVYEKTSGSGMTFIAPRDILIRRQPLRIRQPDILFIGHERLKQCGDMDDPSPLPVGPELVVEILSPSDTRAARARKLGDYRSVGVRECWIVSPQAQTIEVVRLTVESAETVAIYGHDQTLQSATLPGLTLPVGSAFEL